MSSPGEVRLVCSSLWQALLFRKIGELHHFTTFHYSLKVFRRFSYDAFPLLSLSSVFLNKME